MAGRTARCSTGFFRRSRVSSKQLPQTTNTLLLATMSPSSSISHTQFEGSAVLESVSRNAPRPSTNAIGSASLKDAAAARPALKAELDRVLVITRTKGGADRSHTSRDASTIRTASPVTVRSRSRAALRSLVGKICARATTSPQAVSTSMRFARVNYDIPEAPGIMSRIGRRARQEKRTRDHIFTIAEAPRCGRGTSDREKGERVLLPMLAATILRGTGQKVWRGPPVVRPRAEGNGRDPL